MKFKYPVIDTHIHMYSEEDLTSLEKAIREGGYFAYTLLSSSFMPQTAPGNLSILWAKKKESVNVYGYASLHMPEDDIPDAKDLLMQVKQYHLLGFDGIKMIDGKPSIRRKKVPLDDACYDQMFEYLEENQIPILYHSNDPIEFWDKDKIPSWAKDVYYYDWKNPSKNQITKETIGILKKHPHLNFTIAHFFFLPNTQEYELACSLMELYPNFFMDMTPGWEMFQDFYRDFDKWKKYIAKYSNRLVYGTDMSGNNNVERLEPLKKIFETNEIVNVGDYTCYGLGLDDITLKNIYRDTYKKRIQKKEPASVDTERIALYAEEVKKRIFKYHSIDHKRAIKDTERFLQLVKETDIHKLSGNQPLGR